MASYQNFVSLSICEDQMLLFAMPSLTTKNDAAYLKKMCCLIVAHWDQLPFLSPIVTPLPTIKASSSISLISLYKVFIIWMPIISTPKYIAGSRKLVQNASGGQFLPKPCLSQIHAKELLTQAPQEFHRICNIHTSCYIKIIVEIHKGLRKFSYKCLKVPYCLKEPCNTVWQIITSYDHP